MHPAWRGGGRSTQDRLDVEALARFNGLVHRHSIVTEIETGIGMDITLFIGPDCVDSDQIAAMTQEGRL
jgi:hypothetical protein